MKRIWKPALLLILCICVLSAISGGLSAKYKTTIPEVTFDLTVIKDLTGSVTIDNTKPIVGDVLTVNTDKIDQKNVTFAYQWYRGEEKIDGANSATYKVTITDLGKTLKCEVTDQGKVYTGSVISDPTEAVKQLPIEGTVTLSPAPIAVVGEVVTAQVSGAPEDAVLAYQWYRGEEEITGATGSTYTAVEDDNNKTLKCVVTDSSGRYKDSFSATVNVGKKYTYAVLLDGNALSIRNREAYIVTANGTQQLVDKDGTYDLENVYALPSGSFAGNVPAGANTEALTNSVDSGTGDSGTAFEKSITTVVIADNVELLSGASLFEYYTSLTQIDGLEKVNTDKLTSTRRMFLGCSALTEFDLSKFAPSEGTLTDTAAMFYNCSKLTMLNFTNEFNTSNVTTMQAMFQGCSSLTSLTFGTGFSTGKVTDMDNMFNGCKSLNTLDISTLDTSAAERLDGMFRKCSGLTTLDVGNMNTSAAINMSYMFDGCSGLIKLDVSSFNTSNVTTMDNMFANCSKLESIVWDTAENKFNAAKVTHMQGMFYNCSSLDELDLSGLRTDSLYYMKQMFAECHSLKTITFGGSFTTANVRYMEQAFQNCWALTKVDVSQLDGTNLISTTSTFSGCRGLTTLDFTSFESTPLSMNGMFSGCIGLTTLTLGGLNTSKNIDFSYMFNGCSNLTTLDISGFNTSNATNMQNMFSSCTKLTTILWSNGETGFNTSKVTNMYGMFYNCTSLVRLDASVLNTSAVTNMQYMFQQCTGLVTIYASDNFIVGTNASTNGMFTNCRSLVGGANTSFATAGVTDGSYARVDTANTPGYFTDKNAADTQTLEMDGLTHLTATCDPAEIIPGQPFTITLTPDAGYVLPDTVTVMVGDVPNPEGVTYNPENGVITIPAELVTEGITISVTAEGKQQITVSIGEGLTATPGVPIPGEAFTVTLTGEAHPDAVTVTVDGTEVTTAVYDKAAGTVTIPGDLLTSETTSIAITAAAPETPTAICNCTAKCEEGAANSDCPVCGTAPENCRPVTCICATLCTEGEANAECPVCRTDAANCSPKEPETTAECVCTVTCTEGAVNADCEVCAADWSKCNIQADPAPTEATPTITVNTNGISGLSFSPDAAPAINQDYTAALTANEGFTLPETITVTVGTDRYTVNTNGENEDGKPDFEGGKLIIPGTLLTGETTITIEAAGVAVPADENNSGEDNSDEDNPPSADDSTQPTGGEETQPSADDDTPDGNTQPPADENSQPSEEDISDESEQPSDPPAEVITEDAAPPKEPEEEEPPAETPTEGDPPTEE